MPLLKRRVAQTQSQLYEVPAAQDITTLARKPPARALDPEPLLTAEDVARRLNYSMDWVWDHSSRKKPLLPVIHMSDGSLRYRASAIEAFIDERERLSALRHRVS